MRFGLWGPEVPATTAKNLKPPKEDAFISQRVASPDGFLGSESGTKLSAAVASTKSNCGPLGGADKTSTFLSAKPSKTTAFSAPNLSTTPSVSVSTVSSMTTALFADSGHPGGAASAAGVLLSPVLGGNRKLSSSNAALLASGVGPTSAPLLAAGVAVSSGPLLGLGVWPNSAPILSEAATPSSSALLGAGVGPSSAPLLSVKVAPSSGPLASVGVGPTSAPILSAAVALSSGPLVSASLGASSTLVLSIAVQTTGTLVGTGVGPTSAPLLSIAIAPLASSSQSHRFWICHIFVSILVNRTPAVTNPISIPLIASTALPGFVPRPSELTSIAQERPSPIIPTKIFTSITAAPDTAPSSSRILLPGSGTGSTGGESGTTVGLDNNDPGTSAGGISETLAHNNTTTIVLAVGIAVGSTVFLAGLALLIRRIFRNHCLGKAEFPPPSPLLTPLEDSILPLSLARSISQRSKGSMRGSEKWGNDEGSAATGSKVEPREFLSDQEGYDEAYGRVQELIPLPPASKGDGWRNKYREIAELSSAPKMGELDGKIVEKSMVFELPA